MRRSRRSTAGNRMEAALAEFKAEELGQDIEEDIDFIMGKVHLPPHSTDEEDAFSSDFESTDEEGAQEDVDAAAEDMAKEEEKRVRRGGRTQLEKITAAAHERQKMTFNPQATETQRSAPPTKPKRRVSMGVVINAETGEVMEGARKRQSRRTHTMLNTSATVSRMKEEVVKKSAIPRKAKTKTRAPTQAELIARALDMEEGNMKEHRDYLQTEEEKRARAANLVRETVQGPLLRWVSKIEEVKVIEMEPQPLLPPKPTPTPPVQATSASVPPSISSPSVTTTSSATPATPSFQFQYGYSYPGAPMPNVPAAPVPALSGSNSQHPTPPAYFHPSSALHARQQQAMPYYPSYPVPNSTTHSAQSATQSPTPFVYQTFPPLPTPPPPATYSTPQTPTQSASHPQYQVQPLAEPSPPPPPKPIERIEKVMKCYLYHEIPSEKQEPEKPSWANTMAALFGDHVNWEDLKVFTAKGRPMRQPARYLDPRTAVPFANVGAYKTLTQILGHEYVWDETLGSYTGYDGSSSSPTSNGATSEPTTTSVVGKTKGPAAPVAG
ncbi:hypothetical protein NLI96_g2163 [Meripilus lineatus]|uniref:Vps72/YL1 C-terminal domain-containing protein n=1 Tax=Meripilus lineatus TaxID=2056292 RepID=A0AAD5V9B0_9APHY|nr:hypothetical protein NLI96_g2163 [Physisporinus lineatus]